MTADRDGAACAGGRRPKVVNAGEVRGSAAGFAMGFRVTREVHATITDASRLPWETVVVMSPMVATTTQVA
jgi:hypothetical protein